MKQRPRSSPKDETTSTASRRYSDNWADGGRRCTSCREWKIWAEFGRQSSGHMGYSAQCKACVKSKSRNRQQRSIEPRAPFNRRYGMTRDAYHAMLKGQDERCASCGHAASSMRPDRLPGMEEVRALVCPACRELLNRTDQGHLPQIVKYLMERAAGADDEDLKEVLSTYLT